MPIVPVIIKDGKIVIDGGNIIDGGDITNNGNTGGGGSIGTGNILGMTGAGVNLENGTTAESTISTMLKLEDGAVIVTVVCNGRNCTAGVTDTVAVANAVLTPEQIQLVDDGETIEVRIDVKDISETVPTRDKEIIEDGIDAYQKELPGLVLGMYIDISMFIRVGSGDWNAVTETKEPIEVIIGIPEELREDGREFYIIRSHEGEYTLLNDMDNAPETVTISTDMFSAYAISFKQTDTDNAQVGNVKCGLCHICPTFLGICCFIWLAVIIAAILVIVLIVWRRKKDEDKKQAAEK
ncbi:MAG: heme exporter protein CcmD [Lachnospiraceae bacterium]|nr:heme exporter protein CcmD [Lachnospiraceae bacterium]